MHRNGMEGFTTTKIDEEPPSSSMYKQAMQPGEKVLYTLFFHLIIISSMKWA